MRLLEIKEIDVAYDDVQVLQGISFHVEEGEIVSIVGANGAGKSTLLGAISGLLKIRSGEIHFKGERVDHTEPQERVKLGIVQIPEGRRLFPHMTVLDHLLVGSFTPRAKAEREKSLEYIFSLFPILKERQNQLGRTLSGGQQQMLAIARGLMANPQILMLDEPSMGLAPILVEEVFKTIARIHGEGKSVLLIEQHVHEALTYCSRGYVLENGRFILNGEGGSLLENEYLKKAYLGL
jgi:branched-chain amino acid transport system ATP-binding protein